MHKSKLFLTTTKVGAGVAAALILAGCTDVRITDPARTATEQLLLSTATDRALREADLSMFDGKKVYLDGTYFDSYDPKYVLGSIRDALSRAGALLADTAASADVIVEARSGALSTDDSTSLVGIPSMGLPIPLAGAVSIPEVAFYKSHKQFSTAKIVLLAYSRQTLQHLYSSGSLVGKSHDNYYDAMGLISIHHTDVPEKQKKPENVGKYESWAPDYTPSGFVNTNVPPATNSVPAPTNAPAAGHHE